MRDFVGLITLLLLLLVGLAMPPALEAWNLGAKHINALTFFTDGKISFTLFESGTSGTEFRCNGGSDGQWFVILPCVDSDSACLQRRDRIASMLVAAKLAGRAIHVQRSGCQVTQVALKP